MVVQSMRDVADGMIAPAMRPADWCMAALHPIRDPLPEQRQRSESPGCR